MIQYCRVRCGVSGFALCFAMSAFTTSVSWAAPEDLADLLQKRLDANPKLPSLCAVAIVDGQLRGSGAVGVRKLGDATRITTSDKFHLGSCAKSFTATLAAALVEEDKLTWQTKIHDVLGDLEPHAEYANVTMAQLVTNTGGFPTAVPPNIWRNAWFAKGSHQMHRESFARSMLQQKPAYPPGTGYEYSNTGFSVAGVMLEQATDVAWEKLIEDHIFTPLQMKTGGFGAPANGDRIPNQPWGHNAQGKPIPAGPGADNPPAIAPANAIHCSLPDLARYVLLHMMRETGTVIKQAKSFETLHTVAAENYAMGWIVANKPKAGGKVLTHMGSNTMFTMLIWIAPDRDFAAIVASNIGHGVAAGDCNQVVGDLAQRYLANR
jgi:CubicO group peptidase (beta-lactamase class C family)